MQESDCILEILDLCVSYPKKVVLNNLSFCLKKGQKIIISGPNGCGKTTLLKCILGLKKPDNGIIKTHTDNIAYCKQDFSSTAFPISVREVVEMGLYKKHSKKEDVDKAMENVGIKHLADRGFFSLSGGERQRVALARCYCQKADLLLFDEPSSFLDQNSLQSFIDSMKALPSNISVIVVSHDSDLSDLLGWKTLYLKQEQING